MALYVTHNTHISKGRSGTPIQSYAAEGVSPVVIDFNGLEVPPCQRWTIDDAKAIVRLLTLAIADAELEL